MLTRKTILTMTTAAALCAAPVLAFGQANTGGSSQMQGTTQTTPQQGALGSDAGARGAATSGGATTGMAPNTGGTASTAQGAQGRTTNPAGNATGQPLQTDGGRAAATGAPGASPQGNPGPSQAQLDNMRQNPGNTTGNDARGGVLAQGAPGTANTRDGTPGNPPSTATQRAIDSVTGNRTSPDGTGNNPPGTAVGRALDRATDGTASTAPGTANTRDGTPGNPPSTATGRAADAVTGNRTDPDGTGNNPPGTALGRALGGAAGATAGAAGAAAGSAATGATTPGMAVDSMRLRDGRRASQVIGSTVYNENNESIGEVDDLIVPTAGGQPVAIISVGGFLGIGARLVAVPYERLQHNSDRNRWMLQGATKDSLQSLPAFNYDGNGSRRG
ncbi:PRC-barrel domain-containing protein [Falsiroseomonas sp. CW058]|uniref:PRC-barrel domain-containing protein n=1 Tax=Falsiroseomonas sp. CW058 TaxID=3388664 RepID=UPI003D318D9A